MSCSVSHCSWIKKLFWCFFSERNPLTGIGEVCEFVTSEDDPYITLKNDVSFFYLHIFCVF